MREIILDTETTGLDPASGHRIVEIGGIELLHHVPTGARFHRYINPQREMPHEAMAVHGLTNEFLRDKPVFAAIADELLDFLGDARLVIHNAAFDLNFLNAEFTLVGRTVITPDRTLDTLLLARQRHPMGPNSLDALCKRYGIDATRRDRHGALLDAELLADVYIELIGGRQAAMLLVEARKTAIAEAGVARVSSRPRPLPARLTEIEVMAHHALVAALGDEALWLRFAGRAN
ncbi:MAG TPA: DNA polymerase III subunit epsilon [Aestuariivirgaceae bacterium]|nr:DNA polymerase III subunit epsilon [Aestuariivirgaceae bacterium]